jgi:hypothetical protein
MSRLRIALLCAFVSACASTTGLDGVRITARSAIYAPGQTVVADFVNQTEDAMGYGACSLQLERRAGGEWVPAHPEIEPCIAILYVLDPGTSRAVSLHLDGGLPDGEYRLRQTVLPDTRLPARQVYSPDFRIRGGAEQL